VLVVDDMLGLFTEFRPKFVKRYADPWAKTADEAIAAYAAEVRARSFPARTQPFPMSCPKGVK
jgi:3-methyl-2-oxobutanoate hydroxymethyltransferase